MKDLKKFIATTIREYLTENIERTTYSGYKIGDIIDGSKIDTGEGIGSGEKGFKYKLIQFPLSQLNYNYTRQDMYDNYDDIPKELEDIRLEKLKSEFEKTPPIPEEGDGLHIILAAKELGYKTILMWKQI